MNPAAHANILNAGTHTHSEISRPASASESKCRPAPLGANSTNSAASLPWEPEIPNCVGGLE